MPEQQPKVDPLARAAADFAERVKGFEDPKVKSVLGRLAAEYSTLIAPSYHDIKHGGEEKVRRNERKSVYEDVLRRFGQSELVAQIAAANAEAMLKVFNADKSKSRDPYARFYRNFNELIKEDPRKK